MTAEPSLAGRAHNAHEDILLSVFPRQIFATPTAENTPTIGSLPSPGRPFGGFTLPDDTVDVAIKTNRAWSVVTRFLSISVGTDLKGEQRSEPNREVRDAIVHLFNLPKSRRELSTWYANEIRLHFQGFVRPALERWQQPITVSDASDLIKRTLELLLSNQRHYLGALKTLVDQAGQNKSRNVLVLFLDQVKSDLHALFVFSLPHQRLQKTIATAMYQHMSLTLSSSQARANCARGDRCHCDINMDEFPLAELCDVGLGRSHGERAFAYAVNKLLQGPAIERRCFNVDWIRHEHVVLKLQTWIRDHFAPFVHRNLAVIIGDDSLEHHQVDTEQYVDLAISNLGRLRIVALFDYIKTWPESRGAILDIKEYLHRGDSATKARVCAAFSDQASARLLHSGASTAEILSIYINVIHAFRTLDARGVLFEKVAAPIRAYLRGRDDTVSIIASSLLVEVDHDGNPQAIDPELVCLDIPLEVNRSVLEGRTDNQISNWDDMEWVPDPIDAGPDYKASRSDDIVAYVLGLFDQEDLINEIRNVLATHLLESKDPEYTNETRLVELLKARLDANKLQAVEVMLKDVRDSVNINKRINPVAQYPVHSIPTPREVRAAIPIEGITLQSLFRQFERRITQAQFLAILNTVATRRRDLLFPKRTRARLDQHDPTIQNAGLADFQVQIISKSFWPEMSTDEFVLPPLLQKAHDTFRQSFADQGSQRKLHFRPALGHATVELELEDRVVKEVGVQAWKASVIAAFTSPPPTTNLVERSELMIDHDPSIGLTLDQLADALHMDEGLVRSALHFWLTKRVLYEPTPGTYAVLERLDMDTGPAAPTESNADVAAGAISAVKSQDTMLHQGAAMFSTFIANMLRNGGPKEVVGVMGITNMLKMVLPMFTYGDDEVKWLLGEMEARGEVARNGDMWSATS